MDDRTTILNFLIDARQDPRRHFGRSLNEIASVLGIALERVEFLVLEMAQRGEISLAGLGRPGDMVADVGRNAVGGRQ